MQQLKLKARYVSLQLVLTKRGIFSTEVIEVDLFASVVYLPDGAIF